MSIYQTNIARVVYGHSQVTESFYDSGDIQTTRKVNVEILMLKAVYFILSAKVY